MQQFALKGSDRTPTHPDRWYNTKDGIAGSLKTLAGLHRLFGARSEAGYKRNERLAEFIVLGIWLLDTCGNAMKAHGQEGYTMTPKQAYAKVGAVLPDIMTPEEMNAHLGTLYTKDDYPHMSFGANTDLPEAHLCCQRCGRPWSISDCEDATAEHGDETLHTDGCAGMTLGDFRRSFAWRNDAIYVFHHEMAVRNDRFIDLSLKYPNTDKDWQKKTVTNERGWVSELALSDKMDADQDLCYTRSPSNVEAYLLQPGDEVYVTVFRYYHTACHQSMVDEGVLAEFKKAFEDAGLPGMVWDEAENEYGSRSYRGKWYVVHTEIGTIKVGWRKRVIEVVLPDWVPVGTLFAKEDTTKSDGLIHAWGYEKLTEYLKAIKDARAPLDAYFKARA